MTFSGYVCSDRVEKDLREKLEAVEKEFLELTPEQRMPLNNSMKLIKENFIRFVYICGCRTLQPVIKKDIEELHNKIVNLHKIQRTQHWADPLYCLRPD